MVEKFLAIKLGERAVMLQDTQARLAAERAKVRMLHRELGLPLDDGDDAEMINFGNVTVGDQLPPIRQVEKHSDIRSVIEKGAPVVKKGLPLVKLALAGAALVGTGGIAAVAPSIISAISRVETPPTPPPPQPHIDIPPQNKYRLEAVEP